MLVISCYLLFLQWGHVFLTSLFRRYLYPLSSLFISKWRVNFNQTQHMNLLSQRKANTTTVQQILLTDREISDLFMFFFLFLFLCWFRGFALFFWFLLLRCRWWIRLSGWSWTLIACWLWCGCRLLGV